MSIAKSAIKLVYDKPLFFTWLILFPIHFLSIPLVSIFFVDHVPSNISEDNIDYIMGLKILVVFTICYLLPLTTSFIKQDQYIYKKLWVGLIFTLLMVVFFLLRSSSTPNMNYFGMYIFSPWTFAAGVSVAEIFYSLNSEKRGSAGN